jgi:hypothetical protein
MNNVSPDPDLARDVDHRIGGKLVAAWNRARAKIALERVQSGTSNSSSDGNSML